MDNLVNYIKRHYRRSPVTTVLILINTAMVVIVLLTGGFSGLNLVRLGGLLPIRISQYHEYYRLLVAMFLHGGFFHFLANSYFTYYLGSYTEKMLGSKKFLLIYMVSGLGSSVWVWLLGEPYVVTIGASGALFGVMGSLLLLTYIKKEWFHPLYIRNIRSIAIINFIFTLLMPNISILGHLGGFVTGVLLTYLITPRQQKVDKVYQKGRFFYKNDDNVINHDEVRDDDIIN